MMSAPAHRDGEKKRETQGDLTAEQRMATPVDTLSERTAPGIQRAVSGGDEASIVRLALYPLSGTTPCANCERELTVRPSSPAVALLHQLQRPAAGDHG